MSAITPAAKAFQDARDFLVRHHDDYQHAYEGFSWPELTEFNWALDWFDPLSRGNDKPALWIVEQDGTEVKLSFDETARRRRRLHHLRRALRRRLQGLRLPDLAFELESVLLEHEAVAEAAVVPSPDPLRLAVPKAYVVLAAGHQPDRDTAVSILRYARENLAPYKRIRRLEFAELPKTISGKIRRVELRGREHELRKPEHGDAADNPVEGEWRDQDFPELRES